MSAHNGDVAKLSAEERRDGILQAAIPLFAERGFADVTTREIARAAGVSEALLYRHFPSKRDIYTKIQEYFVCYSGEPVERLERMPDSTASLVVCVYVLLWKIQHGPPARRQRQEHLRRLLTRSVLEDGRFCADFIEQTSALWIDKIHRCMRAAIEAGDVDASFEEAEFGVWMGHHVAVTIGLYDLPEQPVVEYPGGNRSVLERSVRFTLRGLGMTGDAMERYFNPQALELLLGGALGGEPGVDSATAGPSTGG